MMASLTSNVSLSVVSESFEESADKSISKYEELFSIRLKEHVPLNVIASFRLSSGETIIIAKILDKLDSKRADLIKSIVLIVKSDSTISKISLIAVKIFIEQAIGCVQTKSTKWFVNGKWIEYCTV